MIRIFKYKHYHTRFDNILFQIMVAGYKSIDRIVYQSQIFQIHMRDPYFFDKPNRITSPVDEDSCQPLDPLASVYEVQYNQKPPDYVEGVNTAEPYPQALTKCLAHTLHANPEQNILIIRDSEQNTDEVFKADLEIRDQFPSANFAILNLENSSKRVKVEDQLGGSSPKHLLNPRELAAVVRLSCDHTDKKWSYGQLDLFLGFLDKAFASLKEPEPPPPPPPMKPQFEISAGDVVDDLTPPKKKETRRRRKQNSEPEAVKTVQPKEHGSMQLAASALARGDESGALDHLAEVIGSGTAPAKAHLFMAELAGSPEETLEHLFSASSVPSLGSEDCMKIYREVSAISEELGDNYEQGVLDRCATERREDYEPEEEQLYNDLASSYEAGDLEDLVDLLEIDREDEQYCSIEESGFWIDILGQIVEQFTTSSGLDADDMAAEDLAVMVAVENGAAVDLFKRVVEVWSGYLSE